MMRDIHCKKETEVDKHANGLVLQGYLYCQNHQRLRVVIDSKLEKLQDVLTLVDVDYSVERAFQKGGCECNVMYPDTKKLYSMIGSPAQMNCTGP
ncbi:hypothetical protein AOLI_G00159200 [Acnodon oligacanthus]